MGFLASTLHVVEDFTAVKEREDVRHIAATPEWRKHHK